MHCAEPPVWRGPFQARDGRRYIVEACELHVVQPTTGMQYRDSFEDPDARRGYDELYGQASHVEALEHTESTEQAHMDAGKVVVDRSSVLVAVWDGQPSRGLGGTADVVSYARQRGVPVEVIWPEGASRDA